MNWWKLFWNPVEKAEVAEPADWHFEQSVGDNQISEPARSIVRAMMNDRNRFIVQVDHPFSPYDKTTYAVLDIDTEEEFFVSSVYYAGTYTSERKYYGPSWAKEYEIKWAVETLHAHYDNLRDRAKRIKTARERNRLIEIYAGSN